MNEYIIKLASNLPKDDTNGFADATLGEELWAPKIEGRYSAPRVAVLVYDAIEAKSDRNGKQVVTVSVSMVQPVNSAENRRAIQTVLLDEYHTSRGCDVPSFSVDAVVKATFADDPRTNDQIDVDEAKEQEAMSGPDELRRHLNRVHGVDGALGLTDAEVGRLHNTEHNAETPGASDHESSWWGWTRAELEIEADNADEEG